MPAAPPPAKPAVLITGAAKRLGATFARAFAAANWHVVIHTKAPSETANQLAATLPSAECVHADLADPAAAEAMLAPLAPRLSLLINSAATFDYDDAHHLDPKIFAHTLRTNAETPIRLAQTYLTAPRTAASQPRRVIHVTDMKIANPNPDFFSYTLAKNTLAASIPLLAMAAPHAEDRIYGLAPGAMLPSFDQHDEEHETSGRMNLLARLTAPEELAQAAIFLATGTLASGQTVFVDSGQHLLAQPRDVLFLARSG